jgi:hypothetical protein
MWDHDIGRTYYRRFNHASRPSPDMMDASMPLPLNAMRNVSLFIRN